MELIRLPRLGQTMERGSLTAWHVEEGQSVAEGDPLYEIETEKVEVDVHAPSSGRLVRKLAEIGDEIEVDEPVAVVVALDEDATGDQIDAVIAAARGPVEQSTAGSDADAEPDVAVHPRSASLKAEAPTVRAVPRARALAEQHGLDLHRIEPSSPGGAVSVADVEAAIDATPSTRAATSDEDGRGWIPRERVRLSTVLRRMGENALASWHEAPQFSEVVELDATELLRRVDSNREAGIECTVNDHLVLAIVAAAESVPDVTTQLDGDEVYRGGPVDVGIAIDTPRGLLAPVLRRRSWSDISEIAYRMRDLVDRARRGALQADEMRGGVLTISNLGMLGVDLGVPILNRGQSLLVFAGAVRERPVVRGGEVVASPTLHLTAVADHRVLDGAIVARFLDAVRSELGSS